MTIAAAKEFIASRIVAEAQLRGNPLSDVERQILYFTETIPVSAKMAAVMDEFDGNYDQDVYEQKVVALIHSLASGLSNEDRRIWSDAVRTLAKKDHYINVMLQQPDAKVRPPGDLLKLWATGLAICVVLVCLVFIFLSLFPNVDLSRRPY